MFNTTAPKENSAKKIIEKKTANIKNLCSGCVLSTAKTKMRNIAVHYIMSKISFETNTPVGRNDIVI